MVDLRLVKPEKLDEAGIYSQIRNGNVSVANLQSLSAQPLTRGVVRGMIREVWGKNPPKIRHPRGEAQGERPEPAKPPPLPSFVERAHDGLVSAVLIVTAIGLAVAGIALNYQYSSARGHDIWSARLLGMFGIAVDVITVLFPPIAATMWEKGKRFKPVVAMGVWLVCACFSIVTAMSFAATNSGDFLQDRDNKVIHRQALNAELAGVKAEIERIGNVESPLVIEEKIQGERGHIPVKNLVSSQDCTDVTASGPFCAKLNQLRGEKRAAERRLELEDKVSRLNGQIAALPATSTKDPGPEMISGVLHGLLSPAQIGTFWVMLLGCMSSLAGIILMFARVR